MALKQWLHAYHIPPVSCQRKLASRDAKKNWMPAFAGMILLSLILLSLSLTGCGATSHHRYHRDSDGPPPVDVDVSNIPNAEPKSEPYSRYGNPKSYTVLGRRYYVRETHLGYKEKGLASWYGMKFHNYRTSSGEPYNLAGMMAAHATLPIPCYARVTNLKNGKEVIVKINDRGPFHPNRIIDLSYAAAKKLGVFPQGTAMVQVETIDPGHSAPLPPVESFTIGSQKQTLYLQIGAYSKRENAEQMKQRIALLTHKQVAIHDGTANNQAIYRVRIGPLATVENSDSVYKTLSEAGLGKPVTVIE